MTDIFISVVNLGIKASWLILAVIFLRVVLKRAPKTFCCLLWSFVGIKLVCPFSFQSVLSLIPSRETISPDIVNTPMPSIDSGFSAVNGIVNSAITDAVASSGETGANPMEALLFAASLLWAAGVAAMIIYALSSYLRLRKKVCASIVLRDNIILCDELDSPFILGIIKPKIYLPSDLSDNLQCCVEAHENAHLKRHDHLFKPLGFLLLSVYWFNPLCWIAYILLCRDIELACDERVIKEMDAEKKRTYSEALLACSVQHRTVAACPLAFGEVGVKQRIKSVLNYKKSAFRVIAAALVAAAVTAVCLMTDPKDVKQPVTDIPPTSDMQIHTDIEAAVSAAIISENEDIYQIGECPAEGHIILGKETDGNNITVYCLTTFGNFGFENGIFTQVSGGAVPAVFTFTRQQDGSYALIKAETPMDGGYYGDSIRRLFKAEYYDRIFASSREDTDKMDSQMITYAQAYLKKIGRQATVEIHTQISTLLTDLGASNEASKLIFKTSTFQNYPYWVGTKETIESGVRYVYEVAYNTGDENIICRKYEYDTGTTAELIHVNALTGKSEVIVPD